MRTACKKEIQNTETNLKFPQSLRCYVKILTVIKIIYLLNLHLKPLYSENMTGSQVRKETLKDPNIIFSFYVVNVHLRTYEAQNEFK